jgi:hypothetical protein
VHSPEVAELLSPSNVIGCKGLCVDTGYCETYNRPNVTLIDVIGEPIEAITPAGIRAKDQEYAVDAIVFATGFDAMTGALLKIDSRGTGGQSLKERWRGGPKTYLGLGTAGFPNLFTITSPGSTSVLTNMLPSIEQHVEWVADCTGICGNTASAASRSDVRPRRTGWRMFAKSPVGHCAPPAAPGTSALTYRASRASSCHTSAASRPMCRNAAQLPLTATRVRSGLGRTGPRLAINKASISRPLGEVSKASTSEGDFSDFGRWTIRPPSSHIHRNVLRSARSPLDCFEIRLPQKHALRPLQPQWQRRQSGEADTSASRWEQL